jgi:hypothetical protein
VHDHDIEIIDDQGALSLLPQPADAVLEIMIDPGSPVEVLVPGVQGQPGPVGKTGLEVVNHGADSLVARPDAPLVYWVGTVLPANGFPNDLLMLKES